MGLIRRCLLLLSFLIIPTSAVSETVLYCSPELSTGFYKDKISKKWGTTVFEPVRFTVKLNNDSKVVVIKLSTMVTKRMPCLVFNHRFTKEDNNIFCDNDEGTTFIYNKANNKFLYSSIDIFSYTSNIAGDSVGIFAGKCEKF